MAGLTRENQGYYDRLHRSLSWLERAKNTSQSTETKNDYDGQFIFYWIALNALYARGKADRKFGQRDSKWFLELLCKLDDEGKLHSVLTSMRGKIEVLIRNKYLLDLYWDEGTSSRVKKAIGQDERAAKNAWDCGDMENLLGILFGRLHVLRNQIFHGCSTDKKSFNRSSLKPAIEILEVLVPILIQIMESRGLEKSWPLIQYPRDGSPQNPDYFFVRRC